jgi:hypothetical protein
LERLQASTANNLCQLAKLRSQQKANSKSCDAFARVTDEALALMAGFAMNDNTMSCRN